MDTLIDYNVTNCLEFSNVFLFPIARAIFVMDVHL